MNPGEVKTDDDPEFRERIERIAMRIHFEQDVSEFDFLDIEAARIYLKGIPKDEE